MNGFIGRITLLEKGMVNFFTQFNNFNIQSGIVTINACRNARIRLQQQRSDERNIVIAEIYFNLRLIEVDFLTSDSMRFHMQISIKPASRLEDQRYVLHLCGMTCS